MNMGKKMQKSTTRKKKWSELSPMARVGTVAAATASWRCSLRPSGHLQAAGGADRGQQGAWRFAALMNFIGPGAYFIVGVKRPVPRRSRPRWLPAAVYWTVARAALKRAFKFKPVNLNL